MKNVLSTLTLICALALAVTAQDTKPAAAPTPKASAAPIAPETKKAEPPASVEFTKEQVAAASAARDKARLAALEVENLGLRLERAQKDYETLRDAAGKAQAAYSELLRDTAGKLGIPKEELPNYEFSDAEGKFTLRRKVDAKVAAKPN